jgi:hypothetical protein
MVQDALQLVDLGFLESRTGESPYDTLQKAFVIFETIYNDEATAARSYLQKVLESCARYVDLLLVLREQVVENEDIDFAEFMKIVFVRFFSKHIEWKKPGSYCRRFLSALCQSYSEFIKAQPGGAPNATDGTSPLHAGCDTTGN